jgi:tetratricopeptide (TPR) repeat protein
MVKHVKLKFSADVESDHPCPCATDGEIAAINLESARRRAWARFADDAGRPGAAEAVVDNERLALQFLGDLDALDRLDVLASRLAQVDASSRAALVQAEIASTGHRFAEARDHLARARRMGGPREIIERHSIAIDQACGVELDLVLAARRRIGAATGRIEDLVPLGAVLADLERFPEADAVYQKAFYSYNGASPFPLAWVCFQLGMLWGELVHAPDQNLAASWYRRAIAYMPGYVRACVHLAEIHISQGQTAAAEALLLRALSSDDPEVRWRLADSMAVQGKFKDAETQLDAARSGFETLLKKHLLAFADHAAEFYAGSGNDLWRALELARMNVSNRPTRRAIEQARAIAAKLNTEAVNTAARERYEPTHVRNDCQSGDDHEENRLIAQSVATQDSGGRPGRRCRGSRIA